MESGRDFERTGVLEEESGDEATERSCARARPRPAFRRRTRPRILLYSHDTIGLGNIRRTLLLSQAVREEYPDAIILIITGSAMVHAFRIPDGIDYIKLPCLDRVDADVYEPRYLDGSHVNVPRIRQAILHDATLRFAPDLMIVDKRAAGVDGELLETLRALRRRARRVRLVLGMRDILDDPERTRQSLTRSRDLATVAEFYDEVWVYGERAIFDPVAEYGFSPEVARKTRFCGYLKRPVAAAMPSGGPPRVLVTTGGGSDGPPVIQAYLDGLSRLPRNIPLHTTVVFGPQTTSDQRRALIDQFGGLTDVAFVEFEPDMTARYAEADLVVSMAGYNTVCELLSCGRRAILVPRAEPVREQLMRARLLTARGYFELVEPTDLSPTRLMDKVLDVLRRPVAKQVTAPDLDGLPRIRARVRALLEEDRT